MTQFVRRAEIRKSRGRGRLALGLAGLLVTAMLFAYIWQRICLSQQLASIEELSALNQELAAQGKRLLLESQKLNSWSAVEKAAVEKLGMSYPEKEQIVAAIMPPSRPETGLASVIKGMFNPVNPAWSQP